LTAFEISVICNIVLGVIVVIFAIDRRYFQRVCQLRHNPIDIAVVEIKKDIKSIFTKLDELTKALYTHLTNGGK